MPLLLFVPVEHPRGAEGPVAHVAGHVLVVCKYWKPFRQK